MTNTEPTDREKMIALLDSDDRLRVPLSQRHAGQIVEPYVLAARRRGKVRVVLAWYDRSDRTFSSAAVRTGSISLVERWLREHGVVLDGQGIYG